MNTQNLNILIVEDKPENIAAARKMLASHNITIVSGFDQAMGALNRGLNGTDYNHEKRGQIPFDAVLTDCMFPKGGTACMGPKGQAVVSCQGEMPYGPMVVLHAIEAGIRNIGLITQGNHHDDPYVFAFDTLRGWKSEKVSLVISNSCDLNVHAETYEEVPWESVDDSRYAVLRREGKLLEVKDWKRLLERALGTEVSKSEYEGQRLERRQI